MRVDDRKDCNFNTDKTPKHLSVKKANTKLSNLIPKGRSRKDGRSITSYSTCIQSDINLLISWDSKIMVMNL